MQLKEACKLFLRFRWKLQILSKTTCELMDNYSQSLCAETGFIIKQYFLKKYRSSHWSCRSSHQRCSVRNGVLKISQIFTGKRPCWNIFLWSCKPLASKFFQKRIQNKWFLVKFAKLLRKLILRNICKRLVLEVFYKKARS